MFICAWFMYENYVGMFELFWIIANGKATIKNMCNYGLDKVHTFIFVLILVDEKQVS